MNTTGIFTGLAAGSYTISVSDANNCTSSLSVAIMQPLQPLAVALTDKRDVTCFGEASGSFAVRASGGTPGYSYSLNGSTNSTGVFSGLPAGSYEVDVTDTSGVKSTTVKGTTTIVTSAVTHIP